MNKKITLSLLSLAFLAACTKVPVGYVGVKVNKYGSGSGVQNQVLQPGNTFQGWNTQVYLFPTFTQNYTWTASLDEGKAKNESIDFQSQEGTNVNADFGITYHIAEANVPTIFQKYRQGMDEITDVYLRNMVRDSLVEVAGSMTLDQISSDRAKFMTQVNQKLIAKASTVGITVEQLSSIGSFRYPPQIVAAMNSKMAAIQKGIQIENEVAQTKAEAAKRVVNSLADVTVAQNEAQATELRGAALAKNPEVLTQMWIERWNGVQPQYVGSGNSPIPTFQVNR
jgi:regulator of protease activity HflC (stomatin/prohibitin superfamily)